MIGINGMAHVILTVSQFDKARAFYSALLPEFGMSCVLDGPEFCYHVGARTAIGVRKCDPEYEGERFQQYRVGLHHICLRARTPEDVDKTADLVCPTRRKRFVSRSGARRLGCGLLLCAVRRSRWHQNRSQSHTGRRIAEGG